MEKQLEENKKLTDEKDKLQEGKLPKIQSYIFSPLINCHFHPFCSIPDVLCRVQNRSTKSGGVDGSYHHQSQ